MKNLLIGVMLLATVGCTSRYQHQVDQSLLLQENQRLEEALFVTHAQLVDLKRENEALKALQTGDGGTRPSKSILPAVRPKRTEPAPRDDYDEAPPYEAPRITIPENAPASDSLPDSLKSRRSPPPETMPFPMLPEPEKTGSLVPPAWSPTRN